MRGFGSDNHSGVHPRILKAIADANLGHAPSYGTDPISLRASEIIKDHFGPTAETFFVFNGTAANVLSLSNCLRPYQSVLASHQSHLINDECGALERAVGARTIAVQTGPDAKLTVEALKPHIIRRGDQHYSQVRAISITQPTELGTLYSPEEVRAISQFAKENNLLLHMDGARLVNAAASLGTSLRALTTDCGVDVLSLGGTKNGLLFGEAVVFLRPGLSEDFKYQRKQLMQLPSKTRFIAAQFVEFLGTDLWLENARHANAMALMLYEKLRKASPSVEIAHQPQVNSVFAKFPRQWVSKLRETAFFYVWDELTFLCRLMTTWDTQPEDIERFAARVRELDSLNTQTSQY